MRNPHSLRRRTGASEPRSLDDTSRLLPSSRRLALSIIIASLLAPFAAWPADYTIDWFTIDGGGGTSTNGQYSVSGTIGQPDAGAMSGGPFTLQGGFWGLLAAVQTPGAPHLSITNVAGLVTVSWPVPADGWVLEQTNHLPSVAASWPVVTAAHLTNAADIRVTLPATSGHQFFRLHHAP